MPCYDGRDQGSVRTVYESGISPDDLRGVKDKCNWLSSALCAILSELDRRGITPSVVAEASRNGLIGVLQFWEAHSKSDISRLTKELHRYSKDEQEILRKLLKED